MTPTFLHFNALGLQEIAQLLYLLFELTYKFSVGVLVDDGLANDLFGAIGITAESK